MRTCKHCGIVFKVNLQKGKIYCSVKCQKAAGHKRWYAKFPKDCFAWLNPKWSPTPLEDRIWVKTGVESVKTYLQHRYRWLTTEEIALEINTNPSQVRHLLAHYGFYEGDKYYVEKTLHPL